MEATQLGKIKKGDFEDTLFGLNNNQVMGHSKHNEYDFEANKNTIIHLYYNDDGHIGSWCNGHGWYFADNLPSKGEG
jgi:hypothetical protein